MASPAFPLRFRKPRLRELVREVAEREGISQNELLEQAAEHEVIARGALLADDLQASLDRLRAATDALHAQLVERSIADFAAGETAPDPLRAHQVTRPGDHGNGDGGLGAVAAFRHGA